MSKSPQPVPEGYTAVTPWIIGKDTAGLMAWLAKAFGAEELNRMAGEDGGIQHAEMRIGDAVVMIFDAKPDWPETPAFLRFYVKDAEAVFEKAVKAGGNPVTEVTHLPFGDKIGRVRDPFGNLWWIQQRVEELSEEEAGKRMGEAKWQKAMAYVQQSDIMERQPRGKAKRSA
jgi:PhnB protein